MADTPDMCHSYPMKLHHYDDALCVTFEFTLKMALVNYRKRKFPYASSYRTMRKIAPLVTRGLRYAYRRSAGPYRAKRRAQNQSGMGITEQYDRKTIYKKKYMPRGKKKAWKRFKSKVNHIAEKNLGTRTAVYNLQFFSQNQNPTRHGVTSLCLYSHRSNSSRFDDMHFLAQQENTLSPSAALGETTDLTTKFMFQSGILDVTVRNTSYFVGSESSPTIPIEMDVYELNIGVNVDNTLNDLNTPENMFEKAAGDTKDIGGNLANALNLSQRGVTPWDIPTALSRYKIKILKKTKYFLSPGQTMTYQYRDPGRHVMVKQRMLETYGFSRPGTTKTLLMVYKSVPGFLVGSTSGDATEQIDVGVTRKYSYKLEGMNDTRDFYEQR